MNVNCDSSKQCSDQNLQHWLEELFQDENIPPFDETPEAMELLKQIMSANKAAEKDANAIMKAEKNMKDFYDKKTKELQLLTDFIQLSADTCQRVENLASLAEKMKLKEPSLTNFLLGMVETDNREMLKKERDLISNHHVSVLGNKIDEIMKTNEKLRKDLKHLEGTVKVQENLYLENVDKIVLGVKKNKEIEEKIGKKSEKLAEVGFDKSLCHTSLVGKAEDLKRIEKEVKLKKSKVDAYKGISVSHDLALADVKMKQKELIELEKELQKYLDV